MLTVLAYLLACWPVLAQAMTPGQYPLPAIGRFIDGFAPDYMRERRIAGAAIAIVDVRQPGALLGAYGITAPGAAGRTDAARSIFRIGSVSKTFTYVAIMRLASGGLLDLEDDANLHLPVSLHIPSQGYGPVKVRHLMTHTAGFEDSTIASLAFLPPAPTPALASYLARYRPQRVMAPGLHSAYSNYGVALLGAIVAHVSGMPYEAYMEQALFKPLGMAHTTCRDVLPMNHPGAVGQDLAMAFATPLAYADGRFHARAPPRLAFMAPAGGCASTAADMARFMRMLLLGGSLDGQEIVPAAAFAAFTRVNLAQGHGAEDGGLANGFFRIRHGQHLSLEHAGDIAHFHANLVLLPDAGIGMFVATNSDSGVALASILPRTVFGRYVPGAAPADPPPPLQARAAPRFGGLYLSQRRNVSTVEKVAGALHTIRIAVTPDGHLRIGNGLWVGRGDADFVGVGPDNLGRHVRFIEDQDRNVLGVTIGTQYWSRAGLLDDYRLLAGSIVGTALLSLGIITGFWRRRRRVRPLLQALGNPGAQHSALLALCIASWLMSLLMLVVGGRGVYCRMEGHDCLASLEPLMLLELALLLGHAAAALIVVQAFLLYRIVLTAPWTRWRRLRHIGVVLWMLGTVALMAHWNLLGAPLLPSVYS